MTEASQFHVLISHATSGKANAVPARGPQREEEMHGAAAREAMGADIELMMDANNAWSDLTESPPPSRSPPVTWRPVIGARKPY